MALDDLGRLWFALLQICQVTVEVETDDQAIGASMWPYYANLLICASLFKVLYNAMLGLGCIANPLWLSENSATSFSCLILFQITAHQEFKSSFRCFHRTRLNGYNSQHEMSAFMGLLSNVPFEKGVTYHVTILHDCHA